MKKLALIFALCAFTVAGAQASVLMPQLNVTKVIQDKIEIAPEDLPQAIKDTIVENDETKDLTISNAYQLTDAEGNVTYKVKFGMEEESITKEYDAEGNEIVEE
ncbi:hypothetical protein IFO69_03170 [Echinicola sp. CAU 1574]|uniref:PepSY domain-containing protein n=1 Tax=Echinicola arenosa TaxID=2774144 RepID=A0ABR9AHE0_9BACT|nr:hypothetical protein [Echinicola arenosa]MBD8487742.1 hypothetical protein [Echinicola arenosa]